MFPAHGWIVKICWNLDPKKYSNLSIYWYIGLLFSSLGSKHKRTREKETQRDANIGVTYQGSCEWLLSQGWKKDKFHISSYYTTQIAIKPI